MMVHAPAETVWAVATDYAAMCALMPATFDSCTTLDRKPDLTRMRYQLHTSILKFNFNIDIVDEITVPGPYHWRIATVEGGLKGREVELLLVPVGKDRTLAVLRYFGAMRSMGSAIKLVLSLAPDLEAPVYASAADYHLRSYRLEAEKRAGYTSPDALPPLAYDKLDPQTVELLCANFAGLLRENREGKVLAATAFAAVAAPVEKTWAVMTDFEHYDKFFIDSTTVVESRSADEVVLKQSVKEFNLYIFAYSFDLHARYKLEPPRRMSYVTIDGVYKDTSGDFVLVPFADNAKTFIFATIAVMMDRDTSLTMKIVRSGSFPFDSMVNLFFARSVLNTFKAESEKRK